MTRLLVEEKAFLKQHRKEFLERYPGRFLLIRGARLHGDFESLEGAVGRGVQLFGAGPFLARAAHEEPIRQSAPALALGVPLVVDTELNVPG